MTRQKKKKLQTRECHTLSNAVIVTIFTAVVKAGAKGSHNPMPVFITKLTHYQTGSKSQQVLPQIMPPRCFHGSKSEKPAVESFMPGSNPLNYMVLLCCIRTTWCNGTVITTVVLVSHYLLTGT